ncbi:Low-density lipoprotein receptor class A domain-containing protein [Actinidia chinensis var. chinensis]|uniref:Low-density lipoprotein receptor class A domain-containing protein n=1 Tax=Actinidia chinensis var. chinensis TaxID=1590841 RepID=A0A2R6QH71_ACTCC|nr:Low-density lipoprotein receptor class A domain-containing protein [Actinidia chinensis var. chinensis]
MWGSASNAMAGANVVKDDMFKLSQPTSEYSDDEVSLKSTREEGLECLICWESFNIVENVPMFYGAATPSPPFFISCPWCNLLSFRLVYKGNLKFPRKNFFLLWMVETMNGDRAKSHSSFCGDHQPVWSSNRCLTLGNQVPHLNHTCTQPILLQEQMDSNHNESSLLGNYLNGERLHLSLRKSLVFFVHLTAKFPLVIIFLVIVLYAIPASAAILALYLLITILFVVPSFLVLYFAYPSLDWLVREIIN